MASLCSSEVVSYGQSAALAGATISRASQRVASNASCRSGARGYPRVLAMAPQKKVNAYDSNWEKSFFGIGYFSESIEEAPVSIVNKLEKKKVLSEIEKSGILSTLESLGLSLSTIERLGLLSKAESLGLLSFVENFAATSPSVLAAYSLPFFVAAIVVPLVVPDDTTILEVGQLVVASLLALAGISAFLGSVALSILQEE
eukprot:TRINITY_DN136_c0_g1_i1.p1 TRINITY_DN136_c0_g1~~TRINITY_DN136_c0_g1_i1.p1  ORF type:complete len:201 (+),score=33.27 TRINITY_DN136_c0_g1_i1:62-664(+)